MIRSGRAAWVRVAFGVVAVSLLVPGTPPALGQSPPPAVGVTLVPDVTTMSTVTVDQGGYLSLFAPDGTFYTLTVPPKAVLSDVDLTMTLAGSVTGSPLGDTLVGAVDIGPSGLQLLQPAMLTITPATPVTVGEEGPFAADPDGSGFHLTPLAADPSTLTLPVDDLGVVGVLRSDQPQRDAMVSQALPDAKAQLSQELSQLLHDARASGEGLDLDAVAGLLDAYRDAVVVPLLSAAETDHTQFARALEEWLGWERQRALLGLGEDGMDPDLMASFRTAFATYVEHTKERCYAHDLGVVNDFLRLARMDALMGGILGLAENGEVASFLDDCLTFTLEMDARVTADFETCVFSDDGTINHDLRVTASVVIKAMQPAPWTGPMRWVTGDVDAACDLSVGPALMDTTFHSTGFGNPGELRVTAWQPDLATVAGPAETVAVLGLRGLTIDPDEPELAFTGEGNVLLVMEQQGTTVRGIKGEDDRSWTGPSGWRDPFLASVGGAPVGDAPGGGYALSDWVPIVDGDQLFRRDRAVAEQTIFGPTSADSTFILRHTPVR